MLRKRSRAVTGKQGLIPDISSPSTPTISSPSSLFAASPRLFVGFSAANKGGISDTEAAMSPTSILETKPFSTTGSGSANPFSTTGSGSANPFFADRNPRKPHPDAASPGESRRRPWENGDSRAIGLGIVDALDKPDKKSSKAESRMVLFGSQLKIQIPNTQTGSADSPYSPIEFGVKNKNSQLALISPALRPPMGFPNYEAPPPPLPHSPGVFAGCLTASEMEMSEDYTCVIAHGPNPKTTHIFDNCVLERCGDCFTPKGSRFSAAPDRATCYPLDDFLTRCYACKKSLGQGKDIFMYRGEKAFCSSECRYQEMLSDEEMEKTL